MVNPARNKSTCQLRLEARSLAYQQKRQEPPQADDIQRRIQRATETRIGHQRQRKARAHARVLHAKRVAAEIHAQRREALTQSRLAVREKVEVADQRRREQLEKLQEICKRRVEQVLEKVEGVKEVQRYREERQRRLLEDQQLEAARRREEQTQKMVQRLSQRWQCVESVKDRVQRVKFIQRWYRRHVDARKATVKVQAVKAHIERLVASWDKIGKTNFEESMMVMQDRDLARAAQYVMRVLLPSAASGDQSPSPKNASPRSKGASFRVLLMVGMLAAHPNEIMENNQCPRLVFGSKSVLRDMECILVRLEEGEQNPRALKSSVAQLEARFAFYFDMFSLWKDRDAERLAAEMLRGYHDIYRTKVHYAAKDVNLDGDGMHQLIHQTEKQLAQLRSALAQVIGKDEAVARIKAVEASVDESSAPFEMEREAEPSPEKPKTRSSPQKPTTNGVSVPIQRSSQAETAQPPAQVESFLSDEKLVHELILNPDFRIPTQGANSDSLASRIRDNMLKAYWDQAVAANDPKMLLQNLEELRALFTSAVKARADLVGEINDALHPAAMQDLFSNASDHFAEIKGRCGHILQVILRAEAPARAESTHDFVAAFDSAFRELVSQESSDVSRPVRILVDFLAFALKKVEEIRTDMLNVHLGMLSTYLSRHGTAYEQKKFNEKVSSGVQLPMTSQWIATELERQWAKMSSEERSRLVQGDTSAVRMSLRSSMMALIVSYVDGKAGVWPELFVMDAERIRSYRDSMDRMTVVCSLLVVVQDYLARRRFVVPRDFFGLLAKDLGDLLRSAGVSGSHLIARVMNEIKQSQTSHGINVEDDPEFVALEQRLQSTFQSGSPVFGLFFSRVVGAVESVALHERSQWEMHASLAPFENELRALAISVQKLFKHNEVVHASFYNAAIKNAIANFQQASQLD
ncbi:hypothetical protein Poli38472_011681 [Pythium oligandrum]|uniref:Uncharacterized protein n=1 Tax=Pythium oligandrum TaxID=41045 RepID=A0A8K1FGT9_PYTOL|nr:hypothetical protein Poli38472_011681 [Pythium oligandrum]|eukprot:TMW58093.1 hypothetical protein Poli38472_011681 [Pythium oligandrum]